MVGLVDVLLQSKYLSLAGILTVLLGNPAYSASEKGSLVYQEKC